MRPLTRDRVKERTDYAVFCHDQYTVVICYDYKREEMAQGDKVLFSQALWWG